MCSQYNYNTAVQQMTAARAYLVIECNKYVINNDTLQVNGYNNLFVSHILRPIKACKPLSLCSYIICHCQ